MTHTKAYYKYSEITAVKVLQHGLWDLFYKTLLVCKLNDIDKFLNKLASSGSDKHTSLDKQTRYLTRESILQICNIYLKLQL